MHGTGAAHRSTVVIRVHRHLAIPAAGDDALGIALDQEDDGAHLLPAVTLELLEASAVVEIPHLGSPVVCTRDEAAAGLVESHRRHLGRVQIRKVEDHVPVVHIPHAHLGRLVA
eukprot:923756-Prymnesium_polylepis.2